MEKIDFTLCSLYFVWLSSFVTFGIILSAFATYFKFKKQKEIWQQRILIQNVYQSAQHQNARKYFL